MELWKRFKDPALAQKLLQELKGLCQGSSQRPTLMEVCGTHTVALSRTGLREVLSPYLDLRSGPGCPVCVTDDSDIDLMAEVARQPGVIVATYGDMLRVPGSYGTLLDLKAAGARVQLVYSALDALELARENPRDTVVMLGVGFETTAPVAALAVQRAASEGISNFLMLSLHKTIPNALRALLAENSRIDGLILPGHVSAIIGEEPYRFIAEESGVPAVITGFEAVDMLLGIVELVRLIVAGRPEVLNAYRRVVSPDGNPRARALLEEAFRPVAARWRGLGSIPDSGLALAEPFAAYDALQALGLRRPEARPPRRGCRCGEVLRGLIEPAECGLFAKACTPHSPVGPCMVSSEGACAAHYTYGRNG